MKILHTADWHIGKKLHKQELSADFEGFMQWLAKLIKEEAVDLVLVSGDVFDLANPSAEARNQYYRALMALRDLNCKIIITGGNHDSPAMLDAPRELLRALDVHVIGGLPANIEDVLIPLGQPGKPPELVVAAIPYLRDADLRTASQGHSYEDRLEGIRQGIKGVFDTAFAKSSQLYPETPVLAMGHLFAAGSDTSESERDIQIGNQAAFNAAAFDTGYVYVALGHIHKPQRVMAQVPTFYSGSPIPLSFSERKDDKRVLLIDTEVSWIPQSIPIPRFRKLLKITGNLDRLREKLNALMPWRGLNNLIEIELLAPQYNANLLYELDELVTQFAIPGHEIVKHRAHFDRQLKGSATHFEAQEQLADLQPRDVFKKLLDDQDNDQNMDQDILSAFNELLEEAETQAL